MKQSIILLALISLLLTACSSLPKNNRGVQSQNIRIKAADYMQYGNQYFDRMEYNHALELYKMALQLNTSVYNEPGIAENHLAIGKTYMAIGTISSGIAHLYKALNITEGSEYNQLHIRVLAGLCEVWLIADDSTKSSFYIQKALYKAENTRLDNATTALLFHSAGAFYKEAGDLSLASDYFYKASELNERSGEQKKLAANYYMLASIYSLQEQYQTALAYLQKALVLDQQTENSYGIAKDLHAMALVLDRAGQKAESYDYYRRAFLVYNSLQAWAQLTNISQILAEMSREYGSSQEQEYYREVYSLLSGTQP